MQSPQLRAALDGAKLELDQVEAALRRPTLSSFDLQELRARIDPVSERLRDVVSEVEPRVEAARARLEQLGPKPKEGAPAEGQEIARDRADREAALSAVGDIQRIARAELLEAEQLTQVISDRRRTAFTQALFERSYSLLSPDLWTSTAASFGRDLRALRFVGSDLWSRIEARSSAGALTFLALAIGVFTALHAMRRHLAPRIVRRDPKRTEVNRHRQVITASAVLAVDAVPAAAGSFLVYQVLVLSDLSPPRLLPVAGAILAGIAFVVFIRAAATALIPAERPAWRIFALSDTAASRTTLFLISFATVLATGKVLDALNQAIAAGLPLSVATRGVMTLAAALILAELLRRFATTAAVEEACLGPYIPPEPEAGGPVRLLGWALVTLIMGALAFGYIAFASFLTDQIAWVGSLAAVLYLGVQLTDEVIGHTLREENRVSTVLQANLGLRRRSLVRFGVLATGIVRVTLVLAVAMLALAPWGVESGDITSNLRAAFFGFKVGDVTISLSTTITAIVLFLGLIGATRIVPSWLAETFLPTTELDAG
ncbi:MAG: DUF3772 domain-containing protein, partial [Methylobacteriaceae bacterium]|nr:DUF3772 domain-containing protein [Methylobacteriaceae bacterium]